MNREEFVRKMIKKEDDSVDIKEEETTSNDYEMDFLFQETKENVSTFNADIPRLVPVRLMRIELK